MQQRLRDTDAYILMEFGQAAEPLRRRVQDAGLKRDAELAALLELAKPYAQRLLLNGHDAHTAASLLMAAYKEI